MAEDVEPLDRPGAISGRRRLAVVLGAAAAVGAVGVPVALAARHSSAPPAVEAEGTPLSPSAGKAEGISSPPSAAGFEGVPSPPPAVERSAGAPAGTPGTGQVKGRPDEDGCPVTAPRLLDALRASDGYRHLAATGGLADVACYDSYALARTRSDGAGPATVIFRYSQLTETWQAIGGACAEVPEAVRAHLRRCA